jgi:hypothetical protein
MTAGYGAIESKAPTLSTYTAGEDAGRLAEVAKEFGLSKRIPRQESPRLLFCCVNSYV